jgi:hypothetical protein
VRTSLISGVAAATLAVGTLTFPASVANASISGMGATAQASSDCLTNPGPLHCKIEYSKAECLDRHGSFRQVGPGFKFHCIKPITRYGPRFPDIVEVIM